ncbi:uncharacterized protein FIESC28_06763 [Fusarium coffeatum]|uniref:Uncharacterized protein n=1 Tax=Fusarium coffeatum TaxID=231269 RepID=A0A366RK17_9HYPO|nr:uncharacterized protein FIESC28_06763 [Fusarium coffeatum]RBR16848.1 hypothetical protein FIESC28_06763 [Fusarium coffeatum]
MAQDVTQKLQGDIKQLMVLRGYSLSIEGDNCTQALLRRHFKADTIWDTSPWRHRLSLCWWTLRAMGAKGVPPLTLDDNAELWELHQSLNNLIISPRSDSDLFKFRQLMELALGIEPSQSYTRLLTEHAHRRVLSKLMGLVVDCANVVATTRARRISGSTNTSTTPRFQGQEVQIVVPAMCVDAETGPLFVADERGLNFAL